jgi:hypothetical protein
MRTAERLRTLAEAPARGLNGKNYDTLLRRNESLLVTKAWDTAKALLRYHLSVSDVAELTGLPQNSVVSIRQVLSSVDGRHTMMGRAGRPPRNFLRAVQSPDMHIVMSAFGVVFYGAHKERGGTSVNGEDVLAGMNFCQSHGANLHSEGVTRRMLMIAEWLTRGEAEITTCRTCRSQFVRSVEGLFVQSRVAPVRGECPFCQKERMHLGGKAEKVSGPSEEF